MSMKFSGFLVAGAVALVGLVGTAKADSSTTIGLSASVADACSFGTVTDITFATQYQPGQQGSLSGTGSFVVNCTVANQSITLTPTGGANPGGSLGRQLVHDTNNTEFLTYLLSVSDTNGANATNQFDAGAGFVPATALGSGDSTFLVEALIGGGQSAIGGAYGDSVEVTMSF